jgi:hypothetical protein
MVINSDITSNNLHIGNIDSVVLLQKSDKFKNMKNINNIETSNTK